MSKATKRSSIIVNRSEIEAPAAPPSAPEDFGFASELSAATGINHFRAAHLRIPPGKRAYPPMAMQDDEVFAFMLEGTPDLFADGYLHRLNDGDGVALHPGTGMPHTLINNSAVEARVFVMTEAFRRNSRAVHPGDDKANASLEKMNMFWADAPIRKQGPNDGTPGSITGRRKSKPDFVSHWRDILDKKAGRYPDSDEDQGIDALFGRRARFSRIGIHFEILKPGRRTSWPHAERDEDEFLYVVSGRVDCWLDGALHPMEEGDFAGWKAGTGITHAVLNNGDADALLIVGGEASRARNQFWYPFHPRRNKEVGELYWADHPVPKLGKHDGLPDALRARIPARARGNALSANKAALWLGKR